MKNDEMTGGDALALALISEGVDTVFGIPGVQLDGLTDGMYRQRDRLRLMVPRHEQATTYMADGYSRVTGEPGVAMVVPGPGMLNAGAGLATAYACSSRVLLITSSIPSPYVGQGLGLLHEIPAQTATLEGLTKWTGTATHVDQIPGLVHEAFRRLRSGRPRPVALEVAPDLLHATTSVEIGSPLPMEPSPPTQEEVQGLVDFLATARRPVIYAGGGARGGGNPELIARLAEVLDAPIVLSENGRGVVDDRNPRMLPDAAMRFLRDEADAVLVLGSRFITPEATPVRTADARIALVNIEAADLGAPRAPETTVCADVGEVLRALVPRVEPRAGWGSRIAEVRSTVTSLIRERVAPQLAYVDAIRAALPENGVFVNELTQVGFVSSFTFPVYEPSSYIWPGYQGTLGYAFPTALGAAVGAEGRPVVVISGDGGFGWSLQELATAAAYSIPIVIVVFEDGRFGNVWRIQRDYYGSRFIGSELDNPDFAKLADAFGVRYARAEGAEELQAAVAQGISSSAPTLVHAPVGVFPSPWSFIIESEV